ncbi:hypothetical protein [Chryseobacterium sp.]|uniref:hypothetical protein n=1 Tax=Chryseobacterium sp. TaxID=1871047 RepID=UPI0024E24F3F|nr:hypothetical protein [Chryseobacterium sp.]
METNEVRIGNYIMDKKDENIEYVYLIQNLGDLVYINDLHPDNCIPIPLTEEWLLKFGLEQMKDSSTYEWKDGDYRSVQVDLKANEAEIYLCGYDSVMASQCFPVDYIKYVHQLQNLFFALKGKELTIKN